MSKIKAKRAKPTTPRLSSRDREWRARDDLRTLREAAEISADTARVKAAQAEARKQIAALASVTKVKS